MMAPFSCYCFNNTTLVENFLNETLFNKTKETFLKEANNADLSVRAIEGFNGTSCEPLDQLFSMFSTDERYYDKFIGNGVKGSARRRHFFLADMYINTRGVNWTRDDDWFELESIVCQWHGLSCLFPGHVDKLHMIDNNLNGTFPEQWGLIQTLQEVHLSERLLSVSIPNQVGQLTSLTRLHISRSRLYGTIPDSISNLENLHELTLKMDTNIEEYSREDYGGLTGQIPGSLFNLTFLRTLDLSLNNFRSTLPTEIGHATQLEFLDIRNSGFYGPVPAQISELKQLTVFSVGFNNDLAGSIPGSLGGITSLEYLDVRKTGLNATVSEDFCQNVTSTNSVREDGVLTILSCTQNLCSCCGDGRRNDISNAGIEYAIEMLCIPGLRNGQD